MDPTEKSPFILMRMSHACKFCGLSVAVAGADVFHQAPVCREFYNTAVAAGAEDLGPRVGTVVEGGLSVDTRPSANPETN